MSQPFKPLLDAGVSPDQIVAKAAIDSQGTFWTVNAVAEIEGVTVGVIGMAITLPTAVAQCLTQLNAAKGIDIQIVSTNA